jgi:hypothetical protein
MKRLKIKCIGIYCIISVFFVINIVSASANTYKTAFDRFDSLLNNGNGYSNYNNFAGTLAWGESYIMMSYMAMYRATNNVGYLKKLIMHAENVIKQRDDMHGRVDYRGISRPTWVATKYSINNEPCAWVVHSGMITYPIADFSQLVINSPNLQRETSYSGKTFINVANWLKDKVAETIAAHDNEWDNIIGVYRFPNASVIDFPNAVMPINQYAAMGRTLLMMYLATGEETYLNKATKLAHHFYNNLKIDNRVGSYIWNYWSSSSNINTNREDISHASIEVDFAFLCYKNGVLFNKADMNRFASTFKNSLYIEPLLFASKVDGSGANDKGDATGRWLNLSIFDKDIYNIVADVFMDTAIYQTTKVSSGFTFLSIANLLLFQSLFDPIAVSRTAGQNSEFAGAATGDFDGDGIDEIITVRNYNGDFILYKVTKSQIKAIASNTSPGSNSQWAGVAAGDFDNDGKDEFVAVRNYDGGFCMYELVNGQIKMIASNTSAGSNSQWAGVAAGDFDNDGKDEFVAVRNYDGGFCMYKLVNGQIKMIASNTSAGSNSRWVGVAAGDFDKDGKDEFVAVRNYDGGFYMYELANGQIKTITSNTSAGSNSQWMGISAGDFNGDGACEFIANRNYDGDFFIYRLENGQITFKNKEYFPRDIENGVLAAGNIESSSQQYSNLINIRNFDADIFIFK